MAGSPNFVLRRTAAVAAAVASFAGGVVLAQSSAGVASAVAVNDGPTSVWADTADHVVVSTEGAAVDADVVATLDALPSVSARLMAPGVVSVSTTGPRDELWVDGVTAVTDDVLLTLAVDARQGEQWWLDNTGSSAQALGYPGVADADIDGVEAQAVASGAGVVVAVIDSSFDVSHQDLAGQWWSNPGEVCGNGVDDDVDGFVDNCVGWDFGGNDPDVRPEAAQSSANKTHGTHVAGLVAAAADGKGVVGVAPGVRVMPLKVAQGDAISLSTLVGAIVYAADKGADVINMSLGTSPGVPREALLPLEQAVAYAETRGVLLVAAAGNQAVDIGANPVWPASYASFHRNVLAVGASTNADVRASFSNFGAPVSIVAPGFAMVSTVPGGYGYMSGTSMASPVVAGVAALVLSTEALAPSAVGDLFVATADRVPAGSRLNAASALSSLTQRGSVVYTGLNRVVADEVADVAVSATARVPAGTLLKLSVASLEDGEPMAVEGFEVAASTAGSTFAARSDAAGFVGSFPLVGSEPVKLGFAVPSGDYAFVSELVSSDGTQLAPLAVVSFRADPAALGQPDSPATTDVGSSTTTQMPVTTSTSVPVQEPAIPPQTTSPTSSTSLYVPATSTTVSPAPSSTVPPATAVVTSTTVSNPTSPVASTVPPVSPGPTVPSSLQPSPTYSPTTSSSVPVATTTAPAPSTSQPAAGTTQPQTPLPPPDQSANWAVDRISPSRGPVSGGTRVVVTGTFPTHVPVYVWFGDIPMRVDSNDGVSLAVSTPSVLTSRVVDVSVRFETTASYQLTLPGAFTFDVDQPAGTPSTSTTLQPPAATSQPTPSTSSSSVPVSQPTVPSTSLPSGANSPVSTTSPQVPSSTVPATTQPGPSTTSPSTVSSPVPTTVVSSVPSEPKPVRAPVARGALMLNPLSATGPLAALTADKIKPCVEDTCVSRVAV